MPVVSASVDSLAQAAGGDDSSIWQIAQQRGRQLASLSWMNDLQFAGSAGGRMNLRLRPDQRQKLPFIKANQTKLEEMLQSIAGRRVVVNVEVADRPDSLQGGQEGDFNAEPGDDSWAGPGSAGGYGSSSGGGSGGHSGGSSGGGKRLSQVEIDKIMNLPLVRQVAELFNASLVDIREPAAPAEPQEE